MSLNKAFHSIGSRKDVVKVVAKPDAELQIIPHMKTYESSPQVMQAISENLKCIDERDEDGKTPLMWAVDKGRQDIMEKLMANHANIEARDIDGWTAVMYAARRGNIAVFKCLMEHGAMLTATSLSDGFTALHLACGNECSDMAAALVDYGADPEIKDKTGKMAVFYLKGKSSKEKVNSAAAKLNASGQTPALIRDRREEAQSEKMASKKMEQYERAANNYAPSK